MVKKLIALLLVAVLAAGLCVGCTPSQKESELPSDPVTITVAGSWTDCRALEEVGRAFTAKYPNCTVVYEYLQDFSNSLVKRLSTGDPVDLFFTTNIQAESEYLPYAVDLGSRTDLDLSDTFDGLIENFAYIENDERTDKLYAVPLGAEMRGMYINTTLLSTLNIAVPTNGSEMLAACKTLLDNGYVPLQGNPSGFSQMLLYPWICNIIANADDPQAAYDKVNSKQPGMSEMFSQPFEFLYTLVENGYYDYKKVQTDYNRFVGTSNESDSRDFFNIVKNGEEYEKADDIGAVAFMPSPMSMLDVMQKTKEDYHSAIEYVFVPAPVGDDGGYAYLSPAHGIAANVNSPDLDWSVRFLDFLFQPENNETFAKNFNIIPNSKDALSYISTTYAIPENHVSHLGQVTFDYNFYNYIKDALINLSKANNPKYMQTAEDGTVSMYPLSYYTDALEEALAK